MEVNVTDARNGFSKILKTAQAGQNVTIVKDGRPVAILQAIPNKHKEFDLLYGQGAVPEDFDDVIIESGIE